MCYCVVYFFFAAFFFAFNGVVAKWVLLTGISATRLTEARTAGVTIMLLVYLLIRDRSAITVPKALMGRMLVFGVAMVLMMLWKPRGLVSTREPSVFLKLRKSISGSLVKEGHG